MAPKYDHTFEHAWQPFECHIGSNESVNAVRQRERDSQRRRCYFQANPEKEAEARLRIEAAQVVDRPVVLASRHNFQPPLSFSIPQKKDPILKAAKPILGRDYRTLAGFCNPLFIEPLFSCDVSWMLAALEAGSPVVATYAIERRGLMAKLPLTLSPVSGKVYVQDIDKFIELGDWLDTLPAPSAPPTGQQGFNAQRKWYLATNQYVDLKKLPTELRLEMLKFAVGHDFYPTDSKWYGEGSNLSTISGVSSVHYVYLPLPPPRMEYVCAPNLNVLLLNKETHSIIHDFAVFQTRKCYRELPRPMNSPNPGSLSFINIRPEWLQNLELDLPHRKFMFFFGVRVHPWHLMQPEAGVLQTLPRLMHLYLRFRSTFCSRYDDPWANTDWDPQADEPTDMRGNTDKDGFHTSCQKILLDWILTFAKDHIRHIPRVTLCGYIKDSTKAKWDAILADERQGIQHNDLLAKHRIRNWNVNDLGPTCHCSTPCAYAPMYEKPQDGRYWMTREELEAATKGYEFDFKD